MAAVINDDVIEYVGILAKLDISDDEKNQVKRDMEEMLGYIDMLNELDTEGIEPMSHVFELENVMRDDIVTNGNQSEQTLSNAPQYEKDMFIVPKTVH